MNWLLAVLIFLIIFISTIIFIKILLIQLKKRSILDVPNDRSSHSVPTPTGGGIAIIIIVCPALFYLGLLDYIPQIQANFLCLLCIILAVVCWVDDLYGLNPFFRLSIHCASVLCAVLFGAIDGNVFGDIFTPALDKMITAVLWVLFMNLFNFMDGIDGIIGVETLCIGFGIFILGVSGGIGYVGLILAASAGGFLIMNWYPAKIFLGDVGSVPIGFIIGWALLSLVAMGYWAPALILPGYFLFDAGITLLMRLVKRKKIWQAHRTHFYQKAIQSGKSHSQVSSAVGLANGMLVIIAVTVSKEFQIEAVFLGLIVVSGLVFWMIKPFKESGK